MENIFEGAKFGDKYINNNHERLVYLKNADFNQHLLIKENGKKDWYDKNGCVISHPIEDKEKYLIKSKYQEPIDEEKLDELAHEFCRNSYLRSQGISTDPITAYKAGYHKAMKG